MSAFLIVTATLKDGAKMQEYSQKSAQTIGEAGGELLVRGMFDRTLVGEAQHNMAAVIRFPSMDALNGWYASDTYQALAPLREEAADMTFTAYNVPS